MARIEGVLLPNDKRVEIGLTYLFGIGLTRSREILEHTKISSDIRIKDLSQDQVAAISKPSSNPALEKAITHDVF